MRTTLPDKTSGANTVFALLVALTVVALATICLLLSTAPQV